MNCLRVSSSAGWRQWQFDEAGNLSILVFFMAIGAAQLSHPLIVAKIQGYAVTTVVEPYLSFRPEENLAVHQYLGRETTPRGRC